MFSFRKKPSQRTTALGLDIGNAQLKAVVVGQGAEGLRLEEQVTAPLTATFGKAGTEAQLGTDLQQLIGRLKTGERHVFVSASFPSTSVAEAELPRMPVEETREVLRLNSAKYLRRDLSNCYLDVVELVEPVVDPKARKPTTMRLLVSSASKEEVDWCRAGLTAAKLRPESIEPAAIAVVNAFQVSHRELCEQEIVVVVDLGHRFTSINLLRHGLPVMTRITEFGGTRLTDCLVQALGLGVPEAEQEKRNLSEFMHPVVQGAMAPLAREIRATVDFFERQHDCHATRAFVGGGTAASAAIVGLLSEAASIPFEVWNPGQGMAGAGAEVGPALAAAVGVAASRVVPGNPKP